MNHDHLLERVVVEGEVVDLVVDSVWELKWVGLEEGMVLDSMQLAGPQTCQLQAPSTGCTDAIHTLPHCPSAFLSVQIHSHPWKIAQQKFEFESRLN
jgi:hypothetical protein